MITASIFITTAVVALTGGALGSYAGVVASRGIVASSSGRSRCDSCGRTLQWFELVPLVSYPALRGHCRTCRATIGAGPLLWELGGAAVAIAVVLLLATRL